MRLLGLVLVIGGGVLIGHLAAAQNLKLALIAVLAIVVGLAITK